MSRPTTGRSCDLSERINLEIVRRFAEAGIKLAPPTSTTQITNEAGEPLELNPPSAGGRFPVVQAVQNVATR